MSAMIDPGQLQILRSTRAKGIGRMLLLARRDFLARTQAKLTDRGVPALPPSWTGLLPFIDVDGTRASVLARRAGISKQAVGKVVRELEEHGLLTRLPDPDDGRAFLVAFTESGLWRLLQTHEAIADVEAEYEAMVGASGLTALRSGLQVIAYARGEGGG